MSSLTFLLPSDCTILAMGLEIPIGAAHDTTSPSLIPFEPTTSELYKSGTHMTLYTHTLRNETSHQTSSVSLSATLAISLREFPFGT